MGPACVWALEAMRSPRLLPHLVSSMTLLVYVFVRTNGGRHSGLPEDEAAKPREARPSSSEAISDLDDTPTQAHSGVTESMTTLSSFCILFT